MNIFFRGRNAVTVTRYSLLLFLPLFTITGLPISIGAVSFAFADTRKFDYLLKGEPLLGEVSKRVGVHAGTCPNAFA